MDFLDDLKALVPFVLVSAVIGFTSNMGLYLIGELDFIGLALLILPVVISIVGIIYFVKRTDFWGAAEIVGFIFLILNIIVDLANIPFAIYSGL